MDKSRNFKIITELKISRLEEIIKINNDYIYKYSDILSLEYIANLREQNKRHIAEIEELKKSLEV